MLFNTLLTGAALFAAEVYGVPTLAKQGEGIHLVNCYGPGKSFSGVAYCANDSACGNPSNNDWVSLGGKNQVTTWEDIPYKVTFGSGVSFHFFVENGAQGKFNYQVIDTTAGNDFRSFTGYKDDQHLLFNRDGAGCYSIYYYI
ncbi:uncharacterized protein yc1106_01383 [Curvularia clavata]|uniref:Uncharacterized protein n=1 Tax=Curvularia clavata TaxID=95742 RepID=A0A9Q9DPY0_CURCL|nr:uncharacterized protein yc1106_01383 [Curvularia clavata]